ncbi:tRNA pseudouridine(38-40) synthase TruA [Verrucomicrobiaceae bacterium N1E253]|uniref:tRNA pseudouridine synthase A n=1 Tax=Oceaniferula marina TaxID=2748318 RepID=A0A851GHE3_9BACT|nr:tRNA pseudouridine(38-40) synthase TruA [Oceaniferula marina]NWK56619.1 tRNA pseudouridine(38-40) synthase TruA [Oceaniferula marina]
MRLKLKVAYDGRPYKGWATQVSGNTVQDILEAAIAEVAKKQLRIYASGRTDTGVHAIGQVVHFDAPEGLTMNPFNWMPAVNTKLPATIRVMDCEEVTEDFHARFSAKSKTYTYDLCLAPVLPPLMAGLAWHLPRQLDPESLSQALELMRGEHDFRRFSARRGNETSETDYVRCLSRASLEATELGYRITYTGNGFLYKMARLLTGSAVNVSQGRLRLSDLAEMFESPEDLSHGKPPYCAPSGGLTLDHVAY